MATPAEQMSNDPATVMHSIIQRIATGPELSKDISYDEARQGTQWILSGDADPVQSAIFFIALRMKRETDDENRGVLQAVLDATERVTAPVDEVVDLADPYDGYNRSLPPSPFLPAVLAACGVPAINHGAESVGPKYGITAKQVLAAAGVNTSRTVQEAAAELGNSGWAYIDQSTFCPPLHDLIDLRKRIIKRQVLTTIEVLAKPIVGQKQTHLITGYVHKPYPRIYALLARHAGFDSTLLVRGTEGGVIPSLRQKGKVVYYHNLGEEQDLEFGPEDFGIEQSLRAVPIPDDLPAPEVAGEELGDSFNAPAVARAAADAGLAALAGAAGPTRDALVAGGALILNHLGKADSLNAGAEQIRNALDNGSAKARFEAGQ